MTRLAAGGELGAESSVTKVFWSELDVALHQTALDLRGRRRRARGFVDRRPAVRARRPDLRGHQRDPAQHHRRAAARVCPETQGRRNEIRSRRTAARLRGQHRRALALPICRPPCGPGPTGDTAPGRKVWAQLADLGVTALLVPEKFDGIERIPVDLVVAAERLGRWCVPGPVTESIAVAPVLLADDERSAALAAGELIATVALPPQVPRAVDADSAGLILVAGDGQVRDGAAGAPHESVDPSRKLFDVTASGDAQTADVARPTSSACWPPPPNWSARPGAARRVGRIRQAAHQFGR